MRTDVTESLTDKLGAGLRVGDGCWEWAGLHNAGGYGRVRVGKESHYVHRAVYELLVGPIAEGLQIDHLCRNRGCANPGHMEPVTQRENILRGQGPTADNSRKTECLQGHPLHGDNLYVTRQGERGCRICRRERLRAWTARQA